MTGNLKVYPRCALWIAPNPGPPLPGFRPPPPRSPGPPISPVFPVPETPESGLTAPP